MPGDDGSVQNARPQEGTPGAAPMEMQRGGAVGDVTTHLYNAAFGAVRGAAEGAAATMQSAYTAMNRSVPIPQGFPQFTTQPAYGNGGYYNPQPYAYPQSYGYAQPYAQWQQAQPGQALVTWQGYPQVNPYSQPASVGAQRYQANLSTGDTSTINRPPLASLTAASVGIGPGALELRPSFTPSVNPAILPPFSVGPEATLAHQTTAPVGTPFRQTPGTTAAAMPARTSTETEPTADVAKPVQSSSRLPNLAAIPDLPPLAANGADNGIRGFQSALLANLITQVPDKQADTPAAQPKPEVAKPSEKPAQQPTVKFEVFNDDKRLSEAHFVIAADGKLSELESPGTGKSQLIKPLDIKPSGTETVCKVYVAPEATKIQANPTGSMSQLDPMKNTYESLKKIEAKVAEIKQEKAPAAKIDAGVLQTTKEALRAEVRKVDPNEDPGAERRQFRMTITKPEEKDTAHLRINAKGEFESNKEGKKWHNVPALAGDKENEIKIHIDPNVYKNMDAMSTALRSFEKGLPEAIRNLGKEQKTDLSVKINNLPDALGGILQKHIDHLRSTNGGDQATTNNGGATGTRQVNGTPSGANSEHAGADTSGGATTGGGTTGGGAGNGGRAVNGDTRNGGSNKPVDKPNSGGNGADRSRDAQPANDARKDTPTPYGHGYGEGVGLAVRQSQINNMTYANALSSFLYADKVVELDRRQAALEKEYAEDFKNFTTDGNGHIDETKLTNEQKEKYDAWKKKAQDFNKEKTDLHSQIDEAVKKLCLREDPETQARIKALAEQMKDSKKNKDFHEKLATLMKSKEDGQVDSKEVEDVLGPDKEPKDIKIKTSQGEQIHPAGAHSLLKAGLIDFAVANMREIPGYANNVVNTPEAKKAIKDNDAAIRALQGQQAKPAERSDAEAKYIEARNKVITEVLNKYALTFPPIHTIAK